jgi:hypothetical protein
MRAHRVASSGLVRSQQHFGAEEGGRARVLDDVVVVAISTPTRQPCGVSKTGSESNFINYLHKGSIATQVAWVCVWVALKR